MSFQENYVQEDIVPVEAAQNTQDAAEAALLDETHELTKSFIENKKEELTNLTQNIENSTDKWFIWGKHRVLSNYFDHNIIFFKRREKKGDNASYFDRKVTVGKVVYNMTAVQAQSAESGNGYNYNINIKDGTNTYYISVNRGYKSDDYSMSIKKNGIETPLKNVKQIVGKYIDDLVK